MTWLLIESDPPRAYYQGTPPATSALLAPGLVGVGTIRRPLSIPGIAPGESANLTADLRNGSGSVTADYATAPPLRRIARVMRGADEVFAGVVTGFDLGDEARIRIEAGAFRPLSEPLPLRNSVVWGAYKDVRTLPWCYGRCFVEPVPYDQQGRLFVLADHPILSVVRVTRDDAPTDAWALSNELDSTGHPVAMLELAEPLATGESLAVELVGKMDPIIGGAINTPARVLWDVLNALAGVPVPWSDLDEFRVQTEGVQIGGVIDDATLTARGAIDRIMQSVGAAWSAGMPGIATVWPSPVDEIAPALVADRVTAHNLQSESSYSDIVTSLRVLYDYDNATRRHRRAIQMESPTAIQRYGRIESEWDAGWLRSPRLAETLGRRLLRYMARPRWRVSWQQRFTPAAPGDWVVLDHPRSPVTGRHRVMAADLDFGSPNLTLTIDAPVGDVPDVRTTALATAFEPIVGSGAAVEYSNGIATFTIRDDQGQPLSGARATLNGTTTRIADNAGRVSFEVPRGRHVLLVEATGYAPIEIEVEV